MWFNSLSDALKHCLYLRMAHALLCNTAGDSASGVVYLYLGTIRQSLEGSSIKAGRRAHIGHLTIPAPESQFSKVKMNDYFADFMIFSARASLFEVSESASEFMQYHVLYHQSTSLSPWWISDSLKDITLSPVRLNERCFQIIREAHPHLVKILFAGAKFLTDLIKCTVWSPSFTIEELHFLRYPGIKCGTFHDFEHATAWKRCKFQHFELSSAWHAVKYSK